MKRPFLLAFSPLILAGCAVTPWPHYEAAVRCHLDGKKQECDQDYLKAIEIGPKTQGLHASYGVHLLLEGRRDEALKEFAIEKANYPGFAPKGIDQLALGSATGAASGTDSASRTERSPR